MGKFRHRAFICGCFVCKGQGNTLHKLGPGYICSHCKRELIENDVVETHNGGKLVIITGTSNVVYVPPQEDKEETKIQGGHET